MTFWNENGTKILGGLTAMLGTLASLLTMGAFNELLTKPSIGWLSIFVSLATAGVGGTTIARGFNNSAQAKVAAAMETAIKASPGQGGFARVSLLLFVSAIASALLLLSACTTNPASAIKVACERTDNFRIERCAKSIAETWETYQMRVEELVVDSATPADVKRPLQQAEAVTRPVIVEMLKANAAYVRIRDELAAGTTEADKLSIADANLERWIAEALPLIESLGNALGL